MTGVGIEYGVTADGLMAARIGTQSCIAMPVDDGFAIGLGSNGARPIDTWSKSDVFGHFGKVADESGFHVFAEGLARHVRQKEMLGRKAMTARLSTPWGMSQAATLYAEGVVFHSTAGHGGFKLDRVRNAVLHPALRNRDGWYEEDQQWAKVAIGFPELFTEREKASADQTLRDWEPDAWEAFHGRPLAPEESFVRDRERFERHHAGDWVVISAIRSDRHIGFVETMATMGGLRSPGEPRRCFLVPAGDYSIGRHGFVIDPGRHRPTPP